MPATNSEINKLVALREIARAQLVLEWDPSQVANPALIEKLERSLSSDYPIRQGDPTVAPYLLVRMGEGGRVAQFQPGQLLLTTDFTGNHRRATELVTRWIAEHWGRVFGAFEGFPAPRFLAVIVDVDMSTDGLALNAQEVIQSFLRVPGWGEIDDAEFRISKIVRERYFLNFGLSSYRKLKLKVEIPLGIPNSGTTPGPSQIMQDGPAQDGLLIRIDANTKVNLMKGFGKIEIAKSNLEELLTIQTEAIDTRLQPFLMGVP